MSLRLFSSIAFAGLLLVAPFAPAAAPPSVSADRSGNQRAEEMRRKTVEHLMKKFHHLFRKGKYREAENVARKASELAPDNDAVAAALAAARIKNGREEWVITTINDPEPRRKRRPEKELTKAEVLERRLREPCSVRFDRTPLASVIDELRDISNIEVVFDEPAMKEAGVSRQEPITIEFERLSLKAGLNRILQKVHLTYCIRDDAVWITTKDAAPDKP